MPYEEFFPEAWECFQDYISDYPHLGIENWLLL
jgi:hypothetical protein